MGSTVVGGETEGTVEFTGENIFFAKMASLLGGSIDNYSIHTTVYNENYIQENI